MARLDFVSNAWQRGIFGMLGSIYVHPASH